MGEGCWGRERCPAVCPIVFMISNAFFLTTFPNGSTHEGVDEVWVGVRAGRREWWVGLDGDSNFI